MWTKRELVTEAYGELALQGYEFDLSPGEMQTGLRRLDAMMAAWEAQGVRVGYRFPASPSDSSLDDASGLPDKANQAAFLSLAIALAAGLGKAVSPDTRRQAREAYSALLLDAAYPQEQQLPDTLPTGAGNKPWRGTYEQFFPPPSSDPLGVSPGGDLYIAPDGP